MLRAEAGVLWGPMPGPLIAIRLAQASEAPAIAHLSRDLIETGLAWTWTPNRVAASVRSRHALVAVAASGPRIAGFGVMRYGDEEAHLDLFGVAREYRGAGLGRRLVEWLEKPALVAGITTVFLEVRESNRGGQAFYERIGYRKLAILPRYYQGVESAVRMGRELGVQPGGPPPLVQFDPLKRIQR